MHWPIGTTFIIKSDDEETWIVDLQSDIQRGIISSTSPFGRFLLQARQGRTSSFVQPDGVEIQYQIVSADTHGVHAFVESDDEFEIPLTGSSIVADTAQQQTEDTGSIQEESPIERNFRVESQAAGLKLYPQFPILQYRADFLIAGTNILIELDGYTYHSSRMQMIKDAIRERALVKAGYRIIRFTSDEIFRDVAGCVREVMKILAVLDERNEWASSNSTAQ